MILVKLKEAIEAYKTRKGLRKFTYRDLSEASGVPYGTIQAIGNREVYSTTFHTLDRICRALETTPCEILHYDPDTPHPKAGAGRGNR